MTFADFLMALRDATPWAKFCTSLPLITLLVMCYIAYLDERDTRPAAKQKPALPPIVIKRIS